MTKTSDVFLLGEGWIFTSGLTVFVESQVVLCIPFAEQTVQFVAHHTFWQSDGFVLPNVVVIDGNLRLCRCGQRQHEE